MYNCYVKEVTLMDSYITGGIIKTLREKRGITQAKLAEKLKQLEI